MTRAVGYIRTREDGRHIDGLWSVQRQREAIESLAKKEGFVVETYYHDHNCPENKLKRPNLFKAMNDVGEDGVVFVLMEDPRHVSTDILTQLNMRDHLEENKNVKIVCADRGDGYKMSSPLQSVNSFCFGTIAAMVSYDEDRGINSREYFEKMFRGCNE